jgi:hypothetical protein
MAENNELLETMEGISSGVCGSWGCSAVNIVDCEDAGEVGGNSGDVASFIESRIKGIKGRRGSR